jgi:hypothetical protein
MSEVLGKMEKPEAAQFKKGRKLFFVPLIFKPYEVDKDLEELIKKYWIEAEQQLDSLASKLSEIKRVYHELLPGEKGLKRLEDIGIGSHAIVSSLIARGADLTLMEDEELLDEFMDWNRCLSVNLRSPKVFETVYKAYEEASKKREQHISTRIDETLGPDESAAIFMREGHRIQYPADIEVFYVAPPSLDAIRRTMRDLEEKMLAKREHDGEHEDETGKKDARGEESSKKSES